MIHRMCYLFPGTRVGTQMESQAYTHSSHHPLVATTGSGGLTSMLYVMRLGCIMVRASAVVSLFRYSLQYAVSSGLLPKTCRYEAVLVSTYTGGSG